MSTRAFTVSNPNNGSAWNNLAVQASDYTIVTGETVELLVSDEISNNTGTIYNSVRINLSYSSVLPAIKNGSFAIGALVEVKDENNNWQIFARQFTDLRGSYSAPERIIEVQPNIAKSGDEGIDDVVFVAGRERAFINLQHGNLPQTSFRIRILMTEQDPGGANAFQSMTVSASGELYNV